MLRTHRARRVWAQLRPFTNLHVRSTTAAAATACLSRLAGGCSDAPLQRGIAGSPGTEVVRAGRTRRLGTGTAASSVRRLGTAAVDGAGVATRRFASGTHVLLRMAAAVAWAGASTGYCVFWEWR